MCVQVCHVSRIQRSDPIIRSFLELNFQARYSTRDLSCRFTCNASGRIYRSTLTVFVSASDLLASNEKYVLLRIVYMYVPTCRYACEYMLCHCDNEENSSAFYLWISSRNNFFARIWPIVSLFIKNYLLPLWKIPSCNMLCKQLKWKTQT